jgi:hypothetical protein
MRRRATALIAWLCAAASQLRAQGGGHAIPTYHPPLPWEVSTWSPVWGQATQAERSVADLAPLTDHESVTFDRLTLVGQRALVVRGSTSRDLDRPREEFFAYLVGGESPRLVWRGLANESTYDAPVDEAHGLSACLYVTSDSTLEYQVFLEADSLAYRKYAPRLESSGRYVWRATQRRFIRAGPVSAELYRECEHSAERDPD